MYTQPSRAVLLEKMYQRLEQAKQFPLPFSLTRCIRKERLHAIIDSILTNKRLKQRALRLKPSEALYFSKAVTHMDRTFSIARAPDGEYVCVLETKSKNTLNKKRKIKKYGGGYKNGKDAWRIDGENQFQEYISLQILLKAKKQSLTELSSSIKKMINKVKREIFFPWQFDTKEHLHRSVLGPLYNNKK
jgi:hypothetical protein